MPSIAAFTPLAKLAAVATASVAAASVAYVAINPSGGSEASSGKQDGGVVACIGADAVLRRVSSDQPCPKDQQRVELSEFEPEPPDWEDWESMDEDLAGKSKPKPGSIADLDQRLGELEETPWFEVVDKTRHRIFSVGPGAATLYDGGETPVGQIRATGSGGFFLAQSSSGNSEATVGASGALSGLRVLEGGVVRAEVGRQAEGNHSMRFPSPARGIFAGLGESRAGTGALVVGNASGAPKASLTVVDGKGTAGIFSNSGAALLSLTEGATQGGLLALGDASSTPMVKMGVADNRYGIVLTGPRAGLPLIPNSGLPGSYIMGCAAQCGPGGK